MEGFGCIGADDQERANEMIFTAGGRSRQLDLKGLIRVNPNAGSNLLVSRQSMREIPMLFGLRGVAALVVVVYHYCLDWKICDFPRCYSVTCF